MPSINFKVIKIKVLKRHRGYLNLMVIEAFTDLNDFGAGCLVKHDHTIHRTSTSKRLCSRALYKRLVTILSICVVVDLRIAQQTWLKKVAIERIHS